jgi:acyl carrier protein phosphodiesterase
VNFLAHCLIADHATDRELPELVAGGFLGDFIKGTVPAELPSGLALGVRLHRRIDAFSNQLPGISLSCGRFPAPLRRLAPAFVDVIADHFLATHWEQFSSERIEDFSARAYAQIAHHQSWLSGPGRRLFDYMCDVDLLSGYRDTQVMHRGLKSITRRIDQQHLDAELVLAVDNLLVPLEADFHAYFPELLQHGRAWIAPQLSAEPQSL